MSDEVEKEILRKLGKQIDDLDEQLKSLKKAEPAESEEKMIKRLKSKLEELNDGR